MNDGISLIVCCYNSAQRLPTTLEYIAKQELLPDIPWEVIIVNNNSSDNTKSVAKEEWEKCGAPASLRVVDENTSGISHARIKGLKEANYELIIYCDDDNWLNSNYLSRAYNIMHENSEIGILGGRSIAVFEGEEPLWFSTFQRSFAVGVQGLYSGDVTNRGNLWGAGMVLRRSVFLNLLASNFQFLNEGRKGSALASGEDTELCKWFILANYKLWYDEKLVFQHYLPLRRLTKAYLSELQDGFKSSFLNISKYDKLIKIFRKGNSKSEIRIKLFVMNLKQLYAYLILKGKKKQTPSYSSYPKGMFFSDPITIEILKNRKRYLNAYS